MTRATRRVVVVDHTELNRAIGNRIRDARLERKITQRQLAGDRFTPAYISALEKGICHPSLSALAHIAAQLGVSMRSLLPE